MNIVIAINQKYIRYAYVMLTSLLSNNPISTDVYILHHDLLASDEETFAPLARRYPVAFHFIYVPDNLLPSEDVLSTSSWGIEAYFRLAITDLLPLEVTRALYLDTDMIVHHSIAELYNVDFAGNVIAACKEYTSTPPFHNYRDELFAPIFDHDFYYFNSGMILYNMEELRPAHSFATYMKMAQALDYKIQYPDQDLLNYCHHKKVLYVDPYKYNLNARYAFQYDNLQYSDLEKQGNIIHYASSKPWRGNFLHCNVEQLWWDYAAQTPFYDDFLQEFIHETMTDLTLNSYIGSLIQKNEELYDKINLYDTLLPQKN